MKKFVIGIDVGGTNIKLGIVNPQGKITARSHINTLQFAKNRNKLIDALVQQIEDLIARRKLKRSSIAGIGIGLPGLIDPVKGIVNFLPNIPNWKKVPLKKIIQNRVNIPTFLENDVNLITLAEWKFGAGKGEKDLICMTLGTGVGSGLILDNHLYRGAGYVAGEMGHMPINESGPKCACGGEACLERYVGNKEIVKKAQKVFRKKDITIPGTRELAREGSQKAVRFWEDIAKQIAQGLVGVVNLLNPKLIVIGGGVSHSQKYVFPTIRKILKNKCMSVQGRMVKIKRAKLGSDAGIIGARVLISSMQS